MLLYQTGYPGGYEVKWDDAAISAYVLSTKESREVLCDATAVGVRFQDKLGSAVYEALRMLDTLDSAFSAKLHSAPATVLNILRGGLNFRGQDACEKLTSVPAIVSFMTSERSVVDGAVRITNDRYRKFALSQASVLLIADIAATGQTLGNALRHVLLDNDSAAATPSDIVIVTVGSIAALRSLDETVRQIRSTCTGDRLNLRVVLMEGAFGIYRAQQNLPYHLDKTDFIRVGGVVSPEFMTYSLQNPVSLLERCLVYDGGVRGFTPNEHTAALCEYWTASVRLFDSQPSELRRHIFAKTGKGLFAGSKADFLNSLPCWGVLPWEVTSTVYDAASSIDLNNGTDSVRALCESHRETTCQSQ
ncbi:MAG TPA: hypothetical protein VFX16_24720 [Pseudonocardiaceae bacterium]|nr:hypothetical protein [Pseudonocardiaceae bacterium]